MLYSKIYWEGLISLVQVSRKLMRSQHNISSSVRLEPTIWLYTVAPESTREGHSKGCELPSTGRIPDFFSQDHAGGSPDGNFTWRIWRMAPSKTGSEVVGAPSTNGLFERPMPPFERYTLACSPVGCLAQCSTRHATPPFPVLSKTVGRRLNAKTGFARQCS